MGTLGYNIQISLLNIFGCCNLGFPYTFLESTGIIQQCYALGFLGTYQSLTYRRFKGTVIPSKGIARRADLILLSG